MFHRPHRFRFENGIADGDVKQSRERKKEEEKSENGKITHIKMM